MRPSLLFAAGAAVLILGGQAFADPMSGASSATPTAPGDTSTGATMRPDSSNSTVAPATTPPAATPPATTGTGANASATVGALSVGEPVKDNTGATIGEISDLKSDAGGNQMAVIKMGTDTFQVGADKLGASNGAATINLTQAQLASMLHSKTSSPTTGQ